MSKETFLIVRWSWFSFIVQCVIAILVGYLFHHLAGGDWGSDLAASTISFFIEVIIWNLRVSWKMWFGKKKLDANTKTQFRAIINKIGTLVTNEEKRSELTKHLLYFDFLSKMGLTNATDQKESFNPDDLVIDSLWENGNGEKTVAIMAFTNAHPVEWFHPTFNFYLLNNYLRNLVDTTETNVSYGLCEHSKESIYKTFCKNDKNAELTKLGGGDFHNLNFTNRFYFLSIDEIKQNASLISNMLCGHDLCGCNLFLVNSETKKGGYPFVNDKKDNPYLHNFLKSIKWENNSELYVIAGKKTLDFAVAIKEDSCKTQKLFVLYKGKNGLESKNLDNFMDENGYSTNAKANFITFVKHLCRNQTISSNLFHDITMLQTTGSPQILPKNNCYVHIYRKKEQGGREKGGLVQ